MRSFVTPERVVPKVSLPPKMSMENVVEERNRLDS